MWKYPNLFNHRIILSWALHRKYSTSLKIKSSYTTSMIILYLPKKLPEYPPPPHNTELKKKKKKKLILSGKEWQTTKAYLERKLFKNLLQTSSKKCSTSIYTTFMTLNTFIQYKFENISKKKPLLQSSRKHHIHSYKFEPVKKPAASF